jgi:hypothetical protein
VVNLLGEHTEQAAHACDLLPIEVGESGVWHGLTSYAEQGPEQLRRRHSYTATPTTVTVSAGRRPALARTYLGAGRVAEALGCTQTWLWHLRSEDPDFPDHAVEVHEPKAVFLGWLERSVVAYRQRRRLRGGRPGQPRPAGHPPQVYIGINKVAQLLDVTRSRALQLRASDPQFPPARVQLQERTRVRDGYDEGSARAYATQRLHPRPGRPPKSSG